MLTRIAHIADLHADERGRLQDLGQVLDAFLDQARTAAVHLVIVAGDLFERRSLPTERNVIAEFLRRAADIAPVWGCKGNHDAEGDLQIFNRLRTRYQLEIEERVTATPGSARVWDLPNGARAGLLALSWFDKSHLCASLDPSRDPLATTELTIQAARGLLTAIRAEAQRVRSEGAIPLLAAHVLVAGSETSTGQTLVGTTVELSPGDLADVGAEYVALGHIHKPQGWHGGGVSYSGSPQRNNFGEPEAKGWNLVTFEDGRFVEAEFVELPARRIVLIERDWTHGQQLESGTFQLGDVLRDSVSSALVRVRYRIRPEDLHLVDDTRIEQHLRSAGAHDVKLEAVLEHQARVRSIEIVSAQSTWEKCLAYWKAKQMEIPEASLARIRAKLDEIEARQRQEATVAA
jgi:exonuclease SbcD